MGSLSVNKLGALSLIVGPVLAFVFFLIQPGGLLVGSADPSDPVASVSAVASDPSLSDVTALVIALGLVMTTYGLYVVHAGIRDGGSGDALSGAGFMLVLFGNVGWVLAQGLTLAMADAQGPEAIAAMVPVYAVKSGAILISGVAIALGFLLLSVALSAKEGFNRVAALITALASLVAVVSFIVGISSTDLLDSAITIARACYVVWVAWAVILGVGLLKAGAEAPSKE